MLDDADSDVGDDDRGGDDGDEGDCDAEEPVMMRDAEDEAAAADGISVTDPFAAAFEKLTLGDIDELDSC